MSTKYLLNAVTVGVYPLWPGTLLDSRYDDFALIESVGGKLVDQTAALDTAAEFAKKIKNKGGAVDEAQGFMLSAYSAEHDAAATTRSGVVDYSPTSMPAKGVAVHAQDAGGAALALVAGFTSPIPRRNLRITRGAGGPASVNYALTGVASDGSAVTETLAVLVSDSAQSLKAAKWTGVSTTVDPVSTSDFATGDGFAIPPFTGTPVLAVDGIVEAIASSNAASGTIVPTTIPDGVVAYAVEAIFPGTVTLS